MFQVYYPDVAIMRPSPEYGNLAARCNHQGMERRDARIL